VLLGPVTWIVPVDAPVGTVAVISEAETTVNAAAAPLKVTLVAAVRSVPKIKMDCPAVPEVGTGITNAPSPMDSLKIVPLL